MENANKDEVLVLNDMGGAIMTVSFDVTGTLRANMKHHEPIVLVYDARGNGGYDLPHHHRRPHEQNNRLHGGCGGGSTW